MKYICSVLLFFSSFTYVFSQSGLPASFFDSKSVVLISSDPGSRPALTWQQLADSVHVYLVQAGADPMGYFELEQVILSDARKADFANVLQKREVRNIIFVTRNRESLSIHVGTFNGDRNLITSTSIFGVTGKDWNEAGEMIAESGKSTRSKNLLVIDVAEFPKINNQETVESEQKYIPKNPLNLEVFKLGIPIDGSAAAADLLSFFRYDLLGKSQESILRAQAEQKSQIKEIFEDLYPHEIEWLTEARTNEELIGERVQFLLVKVEGRQTDLMQSMGLDPIRGDEGAKTVVKYYVKLIVRDELYIGPEWDADADWKSALTNFLSNLKK